MVLFLALAAAGAAAAQPSPAPATARAQARATIRIVSAASLRFAEIEASRPASLRDTRLRAADGSATTVRIVEFQ